MTLEAVTVVGVLAIMLVGWLVVVSRFIVKVPAGRALVIHGGRGEPRVSFTNALVMPVVQLGELVDCSTKTVLVRRKDADGYRCKDKIRASVTVELRVRVNRTTEDVCRVAQRLGAARTFDADSITSLFHGKFDEAVAVVAGQLTFDELVGHREEARDQILEVIGKDLDGYVLDDASFIEIEQVPLEHLDPHHVHDAEAIRRIKERTGVESNES